MLFSARIIEAVADFLRDHETSRSWSTPSWSPPRARSCSRTTPWASSSSELFPLATVVTPNLHEACALLGLSYSDEADRRALAEALHELGAPAVIVTGGHGAEPVDWLFDGERHLAIPVERYRDEATHGAGCTHSASLAALLARGESLEEAARGAAAIASEAVRNGLADLGAGSGPVDVFHLEAVGARGVRAPR